MVQIQRNMLQMLWTKLPQEVQDIQKLTTKQRALIQCLRQSLAEVLQVPQETLITHLTDKTNKKIKS